MAKLFQNLIQKIKDLKKKSSEKFDLPEHLFKGSEAQSVEVKIDIPSLVLVKILFFVFLFSLLQIIFAELQTLLVLTAIALFLAVGLSPFLDRLEAWHLPRPLAILVLYMGFFGVLGLIFAKVIPIIADELIDISYELQGILNTERIAKLPGVSFLLDSFAWEVEELDALLSDQLAKVAANLQGLADSAFGILIGLFQGIFNFIFALVLLFFILMEREQIGLFGLLLFPPARRSYIKKRFLRVQKKMSEWFHGQFILMCSMGAFMYLGMKLFEIFFGMKYAFTIALVAGIMELFPYIGVFITGLLSSLIAINISWTLFFAVIIWIAIAQFLEGNVLVPIIMEKTVGLPSVVVLLAIAVGGVLGNAFGGIALAILGMIFAVPIAASLGVFVEDYLQRDSKEEEP